MKKLSADIQTRKVSGLDIRDYPSRTQLHYFDCFADAPYAVIKVPGFTRFYKDYERACTIICRVTGRKGNTLELEELFEFPTVERVIRK